MSILDFLLGRPLSSREEQGQRVAVLAGIAIFGLDALSSAAYGLEAALTVMRPLGALGSHYLVPINLGIVALLTIVFFSYRQTIAAYPGGGGSYTVARENLGSSAGLLAGSALMIDYILNVAVGISAGVGALVSAAPSLQPHTLLLCLGILAAITLINLRGLREAGLIFMAPTYLFVGSLLLAIGIGIFKTLAAGAPPAPVVAPPAFPPQIAAVGWWLLLKAFASGCAAMTGVEAVSNGVTAFREPVVRSAQRTLGVIIAILIALLGGIAWLGQAYHIGATDPGGPGYQSMLSQLLGSIAGRGAFYYVAISSVVVVLVLSSNTSFADFPRLCRVIAETGYLPTSFGARGRRLVYSEGIVVLAVISALLRWAPRPVPTMMAVGVARPRAQGQAMISTATAFTMATAKGAKNSQAPKVTSASTSTVTVKYPLTTSASRATGAREPCACFTSSTICCKSVPRPTLVAR